jgi:hypothetical protein
MIRKLIEKYQGEQLHTILPAPAELPVEPLPAPRPTVAQHVKDSVKQVVNDLLAIKEMAQGKNINITIQMPIYVINGDNNGTFAGEYITNNH